MPFQFGLLESSNPPRYISVAAYIFREVVRDLDLAQIYGHVADQDPEEQEREGEGAGAGGGRRRMGGSSVANGVDLRWLSSVGSAYLTCSIVKQAQEDRSLRVVKIADMYLTAGFHIDIDVTDHDIDVRTSP
jgi:hypothetical protein